MISEPGRIGLTDEAGRYLEELLRQLNPDEGKEGVKLIKFDLYRLAVAFGIKGSVAPPELSGASSTSFRVLELDPDGVLRTALECSGMVPKDSSVYGYMESIAEYEIRKIYTAFQNTGRIPLEEYFRE